MKKTLITLLALTLLFTVSCTKEPPEDIPEIAPPYPLDEAKECIKNEEFEKAYELLQGLYDEEAQILLSRFSYLPEKMIETDYNGNTTTTAFTYDKWGNVTEKTILSHYGEKQIEKNEYDEFSRLLSRVNISPNNVTKTTYTYNANGDLLTLEQYTDGTQTYKQENVYNDRGNLLSVTSNSLEQIYEYNNKGLLISQIAKYHNTGTNDKNEYEYDKQDRLSKHVFTDENNSVTVKEFTYTEEGKIETETMNGKISGIKVLDKNGRTVYEIYPLNDTGLVRAEYEYSETDKMKRRYMVSFNSDKKETWQETVWETADENNLYMIPANSPLKVTTTTSENDVYEEIYYYDENGKLSRIKRARNGETVLTQLYTSGEKLINEMANDHEYRYSYDGENLIEMTDIKSSYSMKYEGYKLYYNPNK